MMIFEAHEQYNDDDDPENVAIAQAREVIERIDQA